MAFPTTISTLVDPYHGVGGPYVGSNGSVYVITRDAGGGSLHAFKATDPTSTWSNAGSDPAMTSGNSIRALGAYQVGDLIHVVTRDASSASNNQIRYHVFDMSSDTWTTTNTLVKTNYTMAGAVDVSNITIKVRTAGDKIVMYEGPQVLADIQRSRVYYARHLGVAWSADIALDNGGNIHWQPQEAVLAGDRVHFFLQDVTNTKLYQRTLNASNALETFPASFRTNVVGGEGDAGFSRAIAYSGSAGGTVVRYSYYDNYNPELAETRFSSTDAPSSLTTQSNITSPRVPRDGLKRWLTSLVNDGNTAYHVYIDDGLDVWVQSSQDAAAWSASVLILTATDAVELSVTKFVRSSKNVIGIVVKDSNLLYTEYTLGTALVTGRLSATEAADRFSLSSQTRVTGRLSATDRSNLDTFSASGSVLAIIPTGRLSATGAADLFSASAQVKVAGSLTYTTAADTFSASGSTLLATAGTGRLSATDVTDKFSASGGVRVVGRLSATDTGASDTFVAGVNTIRPISASIAFTMRSDTVVINPRPAIGLGAPIGTSNAGGGAGAKSRENVPPPTDLWDVRETYLRSLFGDETAVPTLPDDDTEAAWAAHEARQQEIAELNADRASTILALRFSETTAEMKQHGAHISELNAKIASLTHRQNLNRFIRQ